MHSIIQLWILKWSINVSVNVALTENILLIFSLSYRIKDLWSYWFNN